ncbi:transposable element Tcb1 transposase [Trichonephila clavipes]|nr:transposable element Tcb1 transposase [Trichonephila clavipes]
MSIRKLLHRLWNTIDLKEMTCLMKLKGLDSNTRLYFSQETSGASLGPISGPHPLIDLLRPLCKHAEAADAAFHQPSRCMFTEVAVSRVLHRAVASFASTRNSTYSLQVPVSHFVKYGWKKSPGRLHTWKKDRKAGGGATVTSVAAEFGINKSVVSRSWKAFQTTGTSVRKVGGGRPRTTTAGDDRYIILQAKRGRRQSASVIAQQLSTATGRQVSRFTMARRLHKGGLFARRPEHCLLLKVDHRRNRLQWCREHKNWTTDQWSRVLFTDESRFSTRSDSQRVLIWREIGTRFCTSNIKERHHYGGPGVLVWGGIMLNGRTELPIFDRGSVTGDRYCEEVLLPHVRLFRGAIGPDFIFMDDNARPHRTLAVEELLESEDITRMDWPAYSPDLNPIEHVWDALGKRIAARLHHPENTQQLKQMLIDEWVLLPQEMLHQLVLSMRRRCEATIAMKGGGDEGPSTCFIELQSPVTFESQSNTRAVGNGPRHLNRIQVTRTTPELATLISLLLSRTNGGY